MLRGPAGELDWLAPPVAAAFPPLSIHAWLRFDAVRRLLPDGAHDVLEIGAGQGSMGALLARRFAYVGLEPDPASFAVATARIAKGEVLPIGDEELAPDRVFDLICAFEVLEHLEDDRGAVHRWLRFLRPGGHLLVSVPAGSSRMGAADRRAGHHRRYDRADIEAVLTSAGLLAPVVIAYGFPAGYVLEGGRNAIASRSSAGTSLEERTAASGRWLQPPEAAGRATWIAAAPFRLMQRPFARTALGTGLVARARKPWAG